MKKVVIVSFFCCLAKINFAGCTCPIFYTNIGANSGTGGIGPRTAYVTLGDSFLLKVVSSTCGLYGMEKASVAFNGLTVSTYTSNFSVKLPCTPGVYRVCAKTFICYIQWDITLIAKPKVVDTTATVPDTAATTAIPSLKILNPDFILYPNPANDDLTIQNETDEIRSISFYDLSGQLLSTYEVNGVKAKIPLENYPPGLYFIHVATLSDKIIIRKISKL